MQASDREGGLEAMGKRRPRSNKYRPGSVGPRYPSLGLGLVW